MLPAPAPKFSATTRLGGESMACRYLAPRDAAFDDAVTKVPQATLSFRAPPLCPVAPQSNLQRAKLSGGLVAHLAGITQTRLAERDDYILVFSDFPARLQSSHDRPNRRNGGSGNSD